MSAVPHHGTGGQPALVDAPASQLPPVEHVDARRQLDWRDRRGRGAGEEPQREARRRLPMGIEAVQVPTDDAATQILVEKCVDRRVGRARDLLRGLVRDEWPAGAVGEHRGVQHDRPRREVRERVEEIGHGSPTRYSIGAWRGTARNSALA